MMLREGIARQTKKQLKMTLEDQPHKPSIIQLGARQNSQERRQLLSPGKLHLARQPQILQKKRQTSQGKNVLKPSSAVTQSMCHNHPHRAADYQLESQSLFYCERCAAQLASQGFKVDKIRQKSQRYSSKAQNFPRSLQITQFLDSLRKTQRNLNKSSTQLRSLPDYLHSILQNVQSMYDSISNHVNQLKKQHISQIRTILKQQLQYGEQQVMLNQQHQFDLTAIINDIESQMQAIIHVITEDQFRKCLAEYGRNLQQFEESTKVQQQWLKELREEEAKREQLLMLNVSKCRQMLSENLNIASKIHVQSVNPAFLPKEKSAFRNLFDTADENQQSPQFKMI